jgi:hypothetical protein
MSGEEVHLNTQDIARSHLELLDQAIRQEQNPAKASVLHKALY